MRFERGSTLVSAIEQQLVAGDRMLEELKAQLLRAQAQMKEGANGKRRHVQFEVGDMVYLKIRPYRRKSLVARPHEKLAPRFYGPFAVEKRVGQVT